jgi:hypothetical protein
MSVGAYESKIRGAHSSNASSRGPLTARWGTACEMFRPCRRMLPDGERVDSIKRCYEQVNTSRVPAQ